MKTCTVRPKDASASPNRPVSHVPHFADKYRSKYCCRSVGVRGIRPLEKCTRFFGKLFGNRVEPMFNSGEDVYSRVCLQNRIKLKYTPASEILLPVNARVARMMNRDPVIFK